MSIEAGNGTGEYRPATLAVTSGRPQPTVGAPLTQPVVFSSTYVARPMQAQADDPGYGRWGNPSWTAFEEALGALEHGVALSFASGLAATSAVLSLLPVGAVVLAHNGAFYNGCLNQLQQAHERGLLQVRWVNLVDTAAAHRELAAAAEQAPGRAMVWVESPSNPLLEIVDLPAIAEAARSAGVLSVCDNTFATPLGQRPLDHGIDVVVHSATKYLAGHSDVLLGATVTADPDLATRLHQHRTLHGAIPGPMEVTLALRGMRTLALRYERACANATELAARLATHPAVSRVRHLSRAEDPGHERAARLLQLPGAIVSLELHGGAESAEKVCATTQLWVHATSLGGVESSLERRRRHAGEPETVPESLIRLSVGIEDVEDLWDDLSRALAAC